MRVGVSNSRRQAWLTCPRKYKHTYVDLRVPRSKAQPLVMGESWGKWLDGLWMGTGQDTWPGSTDLDPYQAAKLEAMAKSYVANPWATTLHAWEVLGCEVERTVPHRAGPGRKNRCRRYDLTGRADKLVRIGNDTWILDHKTTSLPITAGEQWRERLVLDPQAMHYLYLFPEAVGFIWDVTRKPALRPKKSETATEYGQRCEDAMFAAPDEYHQIVQMRPLQWQRDQWEADVEADLRAMHAAERSGHFSRNVSACWNFNRACDYWEVCCGRADINDDAIFESKGGPNGDDATSTPF